MVVNLYSRIALSPPLVVPYAVGMSQHANGQASDMPSGMRATVEEAARLLGLSENAVRKRVERGTLRSEKVEGIRYVFLDRGVPRPDNGMPNDMPSDLALMQAHLDSMREQIDYLKEVIERRDEEIRRRDHLLAAALERIPMLEEAPPEPRGAPEEAPEGRGRGEVPLEQERRSWWRRIFFGAG